MSDANVKVDTNAAPQDVGSNGSTMLQFDMPFFNMQTIFGSLAEQGAKRAQANFAQVRATSEEITAALCDACSTNARRAAEKAGIRAGDVITSVGGRTVTSATELHDAVSPHRPGDTVSVGWTDTTGQRHTASIRLGTGPVG